MLFIVHWFLGMYLQCLAAHCTGYLAEGKSVYHLQVFLTLLSS